MDVPKGGFLKGGRGATRINRARRTARSLIQTGRRRVGRGRAPDERVRDIVREGARALFRRNR